MNMKINIFSFRWNVKKVAECAQGWSLTLSVNNVEKEKKNLQECTDSNGHHALKNRYFITKFGTLYL
jgi:hypothetical protein